MAVPLALLDDAFAENTGAGRFQLRVETGGAHFFADEPVSAGGLGTGPTPYQILAAALAACTTMTLRLYAEQKGMAVEHIRTVVAHERESDATPADLFRRRIAISGDLSDAERARLLEIADRCPVHRTLTAGARVETRLGDTLPESDTADAHAVDMEALIAVGKGTYDAGG